MGEAMKIPFSLKNMEQALAWCLIGIMFLAAILSLAEGRVFFFLMAAVALFLSLYPPLKHNDINVMPPIELILLMTIPFIIFIVIILIPELMLRSVIRAAELMAIYFVGLVLLIHLQDYHGLVLDRVFTVFFMIVFTSAMGVMYALGQYLSDQLFGTMLVMDNQELMVNLALCVFGGVFMSFVLLFYMKRRGINHLNSSNLNNNNMNDDRV